MARVGRYARLADWLDQRDRDTIELGFHEIERIIVAKLPPSAAKYQQFWPLAITPVRS